MTIQQTPPTTIPAVPPQAAPPLPPVPPAVPPAPLPAAPAAPAWLMSVRCLWVAVGALAAGGLLYVVHEHPTLGDPASTVGTLGALVLGAGLAVTRR